MVEAFEISDQESLKSWLEVRPKAKAQADAVTISTCAALRMMPVFVSPLGQDWARNSDLTALPVLRNILISGVVRYYPTLEIEAASAAAATAASAFSSAASAFASAFAAVAIEIWQQSGADAALIEAGIDPFQSPLWRDGPPDWTPSQWHRARDWLGSNRGHDFWIRWYQAALDGRPMTGDWDSHWKMLHDIALIPADDWDQGAEHVAGLINVIAEKSYLQRQIQDLKQRISDEIFNHQSLGQHSHNLPDDLPDSSIVEYRAALKDAKEALLELEEALEPSIPDPTLLDKLTERLKGIRVKLAIVLTVGFTAAAGSFGTAAGSDIYNWLVDEGLPHLSRIIRDTPVAADTMPSPKLSGKR